MDDEFDYYLSSATVRLIRFKARQIAGRFGFARDEFLDLQQTLLAHCLERSRSFDSGRSSRDRFTRVIVERQVATIISAQKAQRRDYRLCESLRVRRDNPESRPGHRSWDSGKCDYPMLGIGHFESPEWSLLLKCDVERTMAILPPELREVCRLLMVTDGIASVAVIVGISRAALYRRISEIRAVFVKRNLTRYLPKFAPVRKGKG